MKVYRLHNRSDHAPASPLTFLERSGAENYRAYVRWPYLKTGRYPLGHGGSIELDALDLRTEELELNATVIVELDIILIEKQGLVGSCHLLPGACFDPDTWEPANMAELSHPQAGALLDAAKEQLSHDANAKDQPGHKDPRWRP